MDAHNIILYRHIYAQAHTHVHTYKGTHIYIHTHVHPHYGWAVFQLMLIYVVQIHYHSIFEMAVIGASLSEPRHMGSTVKSVFLLACLSQSSLIWLKSI